ncbi:mCG147849 [Mus musculus]|nr:mCG147849 [Mus musculus]
MGRKVGFFPDGRPPALKRLTRSLRQAWIFDLRPYPVVIRCFFSFRRVVGYKDLRDHHPQKQRHTSPLFCSCLWPRWGPHEDPCTCFISSFPSQQRNARGDLMETGNYHILARSTGDSPFLSRDQMGT